MHREVNSLDTVEDHIMAIAKEPEFTEAIETTADTDQQLQIPSELPVLPLRDIVIYPFMIVPLFVSREKSIRAVDEALAENRMILLASQKISIRKNQPRKICIQWERPR
jgi:ATP-dependent Lon protease